MQVNQIKTLFSVGFRPFFILALMYGMIAPVLWGLIFSGRLSLNSPSLNPFLWHAHEMLFGFGLAVLGGFLLTASKNWVKIRGINGTPLMILVGLWLFERFVIYYPGFFGGIQSWLWQIFNNLFIFSLSGYLFYTLFKYRKNDTFSDNFFFYILLIVIIFAKNLLLNAEYYKIGIDLSVGLFRLAFAVMFERTITQFMKNTEGLELYRNRYLDYAIKIFILLSAFSGFMADKVAGPVFLAAAILLFVRWIIWKPLAGFKKFGNAVMYFGYFGLTLHLFLEALNRFQLLPGQPGTSSLHTFTFLCMGIVIPGMLIRICQGHTGRKPEFLASDKIAISLIVSAAVFRLILPIFNIENYSNYIFIAAICWSLCYVLLGRRLIPFCLSPRIDGKEH